MNPEAIIAVYGIPNADGEVMSEQEALLALFDQLTRYPIAMIQCEEVWCRLVDFRMVGDRTSGKIVAQFTKGETHEH